MVRKGYIGTLPLVFLPLPLPLPPSSLSLSIRTRFLTLFISWPLLTRYNCWRRANKDYGPNFIPSVGKRGNVGWWRRLTVTIWPLAAEIQAPRVNCEPTSDSASQILTPASSAAGDFIKDRLFSFRVVHQPPSIKLRRHGSDRSQPQLRPICARCRGRHWRRVLHRHCVQTSLTYQSIA